MRTFATTLALGLAVLLAPASRAQTAQSRVLATGTVSTTVYNNGNIGGDCSGAQLAFFFSGDEGLCGAGFLVGLSSTSVIGDAYILNATTGWTPGTIGASTVFPYTGYTTGARATFTNAANGLSVEMNAYASPTNPDAVIFRYDVTNTGTAARTNVYMGLFADWDVGGAAYGTNTAAVNTALDLLYVQDPTLASANVYGTASLSGDLVGWRYRVPYPAAAGQPQSRPELYQGLTTDSTLTSAPADQRTVIGTGPYTLAAGATQTVAYTLAAGTSVADLLANVTAARGSVVVAGEDGPDASGYALRAAQPNPVRHHADLAFTIPADLDVRVSVYDALGRVVATLSDGPRAAGDHTVSWDASALSAGVYVVRVEAGGRQMTQRVSVVR